MVPNTGRATRADDRDIDTTDPDLAGILKTVAVGVVPDPIAEHRGAGGRHVAKVRLSKSLRRRKRDHR